MTDRGTKHATGSAAPGSRHKTVLITGASSGIGRALAIEYAAPGRELILIGRNQERLAEVAAACAEKGAAVTKAAIDVRDRTGLAEFILEADRKTPVDLVIAGAGITGGIGRSRPFETPEAVRVLLATNLVGAINTVEPLLQSMTARRRGRIALIGSISGLRGMPYSPAYNASKAAIHSYAESIRGTLARNKVGVSLIIAGFVRTPLNADMECPKPLAVSAEKAARTIRRGLDRGRSVIAFPKILVFGTRLLPLLPRRLVDRVMTSIQVEIPETADRVSEAGDGRKKPGTN
ncbi:MAG: SDR family NAD(P)-dependent oxidoreductase [Hyphomicrobiales bacterium]|nr:SDR family NAD(P)-dependent oxidoreductase [Hyphomicrobiales bacterium]